MLDRTCAAICGVLLPPLATFLDRGCAADFWINLILFILLWFPGVIHYFHLRGVEISQNILCLFLPPVAVFMKFGCTGEFWISLILTIFLWLPGEIYSYYVLMP